MDNKVMVIITTMFSLLTLYFCYEEYKNDNTKKKRFRTILWCTSMIVILNIILFIKC